MHVTRTYSAMHVATSMKLGMFKGYVHDGVIEQYLG